MIRFFSSRLPVDLRRSLQPLVTSDFDPTIRLRDRHVLRTMRTPEGPATIAVEQWGARFRAEAWGPGGRWALEQVPAAVGAEDCLDGFRPDRHSRVARAHHHRPGLRMIRTGLVGDVLVPTILAQRVTGKEAGRSWTRVVRRHGEPAPGPGSLCLPPAPEKLGAIPYWEWHELGVERSRAVTVARACRHLPRLQEAVTMSPPDASARLCAVPGIGPWTAALVLRLAAGDKDLVEVGDFHIKHHVAWNLAGEPRGTDQRMLELLEPFAGHRGRVVRLLLSAGQRAPTFGPRQRIVAVSRL